MKYLVEVCFKYILLLLALFFILNGLFVSVVSNRNLGIYLEIVLGIVIIVYVYFWHVLTKNKFINSLVILFITIEIILVSVLVYYGSQDKTDFNEDAVIILGAGIHGYYVSRALADRLDKALDYSQVNPKAIFIVSGAQGPQEFITEAEAMKRYLIYKGCDANRIIKEERAHSTKYNFIYSKKILDDMFKKKYKVLFITNDFHIFRANILSKRAGLNAGYLSAETIWYIKVACYLRESLAVIKSFITRL
jgi:uncharacterized SAM-binding protein YcdF (DUF218 family)